MAPLPSVGLHDLTRQPPLPARHPARHCCLWSGSKLQKFMIRPPRHTREGRIDVHRQYGQLDRPP